MKVLMTSDCVGGVWTYALELARALAAHEVDVVLATEGPLPHDDQRDEAAGIDNLRLESIESKLEWMDDPWDDLDRVGRWLLALERRHRPDVVHLNSYAHGKLDWRAPTLAVGHSCVCSWWRAVEGCPAPGDWDRYRRVVRDGLQAVDAVVSVTQAMLAALGREHGPFIRSTAIHNARAAAAFDAKREKEPLIFTAGRIWDGAKNVALLDSVAPALRWEVAVAGDNCRPDGRLAKTAGIRLLGRLTTPRIRDWYARAAIFCSPARYEPFGLAALEAALSGCALVLGDIPTLREVWGDTARYVNPDDPTGLHATLTELIDDPAERARLAASARGRALQLTPARQAARYLELYQDLVATRRLREGSQVMADSQAAG